MLRRTSAPRWMERMMSVDSTAYLMRSTAGEQQRLIRQAKFLRNPTERLLHAAGIAAGMRVLDVGCGVGDVSLLAATLVGTAGSVLGVDHDEACLATARARAAALGLGNVSFVAGDLRDSVVGRDVDAVVGRLILTHLPDPVATLREAAAAVRPGGLIRFHEPISTRGPPY